MPPPELATLSSSKSGSHLALGQFMTVEEYLEELNFQYIMLHKKNFALADGTAMAITLTASFFPPSSAKHFGMRFQIQIRTLGDEQGVFCIHVLFGTKELPFYLVHDSL